MAAVTCRSKEAGCIISGGRALFVDLSGDGGVGESEMPPCQGVVGPCLVVPAISVLRKQCFYKNGGVQGARYRLVPTRDSLLSVDAPGVKTDCARIMFSGALAAVPLAIDPSTTDGPSIASPFEPEMTIAAHYDIDPCQPESGEEVVIRFGKSSRTAVVEDPVLLYLDETDEPPALGFRVKLKPKSDSEDFFTPCDVGALVNSRVDTTKELLRGIVVWPQGNLLVVCSSAHVLPFVNNKAPGVSNLTASVPKSVHFDKVDDDYGDDVSDDEFDGLDYDETLPPYYVIGVTADEFTVAEGDRYIHPQDFKDVQEQYPEVLSPDAKNVPYPDCQLALRVSHSRISEVQSAIAAHVKEFLPPALVEYSCRSRAIITSVQYGTDTTDSTSRSPASHVLYANHE